MWEQHFQMYSRERAFSQSSVFFVFKFIQINVDIPLISDIEISVLLQVKDLILKVQFKGEYCVPSAHHALSNVVISNQLTRKTGAGEGRKIIWTRDPP